jgi:hypothetical protein
MARLLASLFLIGAAVACASCVFAQSSVGEASKSVGVQPAPVVSAKPVQGDVPAETLDRLRAQLASQKGLAAQDVKVVSAEAVNWPNGALGCPRPGAMYTQAIVPGYRVVLEAAGERFAYHASKTGQFKLCTSKAGTLAPRSSQ